VTGSEQAFLIDCHGEDLCAILHEPRHASTRSRGVLVIVGGPNYRAGSCRQFVLLARHLADLGYPVLRFDYRGMGDSEGAMRTFESIGDDIRAAVNAFFSRCPDLDDVILFGLCDGASAALMYAPEDVRVGSLILVNPWVRSEQTEAKAYLRHYYRSRLISSSFWTKVIEGRLDWRASLRSFGELASRARRSGGSGRGVQETTLESKMSAALKKYSAPTLIVLSGADLTAKEFIDTAADSPAWQDLLGEDRVRTVHIANADHTLSRADWRATLHADVGQWLSQQHAVASE